MCLMGEHEHSLHMVQLALGSNRKSARYRCHHQKTCLVS